MIIPSSLGSIGFELMVAVLTRLSFEICFVVVPILAEPRLLGGDSSRLPPRRGNASELIALWR